MSWEDILKEEKTRLQALMDELEKKSLELQVLSVKGTFNDMDKMLQLQKEISELTSEIDEEVKHKIQFGLDFGEENQ